MKEMTLGEICDAVNGRFLKPCDKNSKTEKLTTDTREIEKGSLFIPLKGDNFDGHDFIEQAFEKEALCCFSEIEIESNGIIIIVEDTRKAFRMLAMYYLTLFNVKVVGITGSVGKTTTKDMIASVLEEKYKVLKTQGNFNNEIGLPKTIFNLKDDHEVAVLEMGMNSFGEIRRLSEIAKPDIAVITNVGVSHIENLGSREGILQAKSEIFEYLKKDGVAVLNADNDMISTLRGKLNFKTFWFGIENKSDFYAENIVPMGLEGIKCTILCEGERTDVTIPVPGEHMVLNALSAAAVGKSLNLNMEQIKRGIENFAPTAMRMAVNKTDFGLTLINDAYNANPVSMKAAIDVLCTSQGRTVAILGDMFELGDFAPSLHYEVGEYAAKSCIFLSICIGEISSRIYDGIKENGGNAIYFKTQEEFLQSNLKEIFISGDTVLIKASRGMHFEKTAEKLQEVK
ncbi:MAG: UDP-N-acetylmuramoyl-tripeptide--D-alanyl-D-alanine ligase [Lachnospiraceae bacterium]|nr:UDP-N-acetylmuramoyl-tripeptide--D-alanyl-D-alanine ligase [Lachnospiraceae bacterium]